MMPVCFCGSLEQLEMTNTTLLLVLLIGPDNFIILPWPRITHQSDFRLAWKCCRTWRNLVRMETIMATSPKRPWPPLSTWISYLTDRHFYRGLPTPLPKYFRHLPDLCPIPLCRLLDPIHSGYLYRRIAPTQDPRCAPETMGWAGSHVPGRVVAQQPGFRAKGEWRARPWVFGSGH